MLDWKIPLYKVHVDKDDIRGVTNVIKRGTFWAGGPEIEEFEKSLSNYIGSKYCVSFNSGTSALHASLLSLGISYNDEVLVPSFTFISTVNAPLMTNAIPKFVDIEDSSFGLNPKMIKSSISKNSKAIMPIHYAGLPCKILELKELSKYYNLFLIEDAAESIGASVNGKKVGSFGDIGVFSFAGNKVLTTGEGGAIVTDSKKIYDKLKLIRSHGRDEKQNYFSSTEKPNYVTLGYNWRMSSITAALGISQLNKIDKLISLRRKNANYLSKKLKKIKKIKTPSESINVKHAYQMYTIRLPNSNIRNKLKKFLQTKKIMSKVFFHPVHKTSFYKKNSHNIIKLPTTENVSNQVLSLPMYPGLTKNELNYICDSINEFFENNDT
jgi:perosamine synthetase